jgi:hypothetical protein
MPVARIDLRQPGRDAPAEWVVAGAPVGLDLEAVSEEEIAGWVATPTAAASKCRPEARREN